MLAAQRPPPPPQRQLRVWCVWSNPCGSLLDKRIVLALRPVRSARLLRGWQIAPARRRSQVVIVALRLALTVALHLLDTADAICCNTMKPLSTEELPRW